jgi:preflagellin peptidase FlaK
MKTGLTLAFLLYASYSDHKTREVSNTVWMFFAPPAFALTMVELLIYDSSNMINYGLSFGLTAVLSVALFYSGGFGGADAKAMMCIALAFPFYPRELILPLSGEISPVSKMFFPITIFSNSVLFAALTAIYILIRNIVWHKRKRRNFFENGQKKDSIGKKILVTITGYKIPINRLKEKWHIYPLEDVEEQTESQDLKRKLIVIPREDKRNETVERLNKAIETGKIQDYVWATPGLPMLIFVTLGFIVALFLGDAVWLFIRSLLG